MLQISLCRKEISLKYDAFFIFDADFLTLLESQLCVQIINIEWMHLVMSVKHAELNPIKKEHFHRELLFGWKFLASKESA